MVTVSVVVALYNSERYIKECIDSVLNQSLKEIELICVDDASTDSTPQILSEYAFRDSRVKIITLNENAGAQIARNAGVAIAQGEYIITIDHDDWLGVDALEKAVSEFYGREDVNCVVLREVRVRMDGSSFDPEGRIKEKEITGEEAYYASMPWHISGRCLVRTSLQRKFLFDNSDRVYGEDNTGRLHFLFSPKVRQSEGIYYYRLLPDSLSHRISMSSIDVLQANKSMSRQLKELGLSEKIRSAHENFRWLMIIDAYKYYFMYRELFTKQQKQKAIEIMRSNMLDVDFSIVAPKNKRKPGLFPFPHSWLLFSLEEEIYFRIKKFIGRL